MFVILNNLYIQANGLDERYNQTLQSMLVKVTHTKKEAWDQFLDTWVYANNTSVHDATAFSPFEVMFGSKALLPIDVDIDDRNPDEVLQQECTNRSPATVEQLTSHRQYLLEAAKANIQKALEKQKEQYDRKQANPNAFAIGEMVLRKDFIRKRRAGGKMEACYHGPYLIIKYHGIGFYGLQNVADPSDDIPRISGAHLKPYKEPPAVRYPSFCMFAKSWLKI